jgi:hypothetical protein
MGYCGTWGGGAFLVLTTGGGKGILGGMDAASNSRALSLA